MKRHITERVEAADGLVVEMEYDDGGMPTTTILRWEGAHLILPATVLERAANVVTKKIEDAPGHFDECVCFDHGRYARKVDENSYRRACPACEPDAKPYTLPSLKQAKP